MIPQPYEKSALACLEYCPVIDRLLETNSTRLCRVTQCAGKHVLARHQLNATIILENQLLVKVIQNLHSQLRVLCTQKLR